MQPLSLHSNAHVASRSLWLGLLLLTFPAPLASQAGTPDDFVALVARTSPELASLRTRLDAARARADAAGLAPPSVLSAEVEDVPGGLDVTRATFRLLVGRELVTGGRGEAARVLAAGEVALAEAEVAKGGQRLAGETHRAVWRLVGWLGTTRRLSAQDSLLAEAEAAVTSRLASASARYVDVLRVRTERLRVQNDRWDALAEERSARASLLGLVGPRAVPDAERMLSALALDTAMSFLPLPVSPPSLDSLIALSGPIRIAEARGRIREAELIVARATTRMRLAVSAGLQRSVENGAGRLGPAAGISVSLPFTAARANRASIRSAELGASAAGDALAAVRGRVTGAIVAAGQRYDATRARLDIYDAALLQSARDEREGALGAFRTGDLSLLEFLDFEQALARAEIEHLRARVSVAEAYSTLIAAGSMGEAEPRLEEMP